MQEDILGEIAPLGQNALVNQYLRWLHDQRLNVGGTGEREEGSIVFASPLAERPFLSVIMRTQGKRIEELVEALSSLEGQTNRDFELIVVGHNVDEGHEAAIRGALDDLDEWLRQRCTFLLAQGGTRSRPLNVALGHVRGRYFSIFDEDDLVYDNWVAAFAELAAASPDHVMYCFVETQQWGVREKDGMRELFVVGQNKGREYCQHPNGIDLLFGNRCPLMGLAFPAKLASVLGFRFDERLQTTEDWHFFMRARNAFPFVSSEEHVALYRLWSEKGGYSSQEVGRERWESDARLVADTFANMPWLFGADLVSQAHKLIDTSWLEEDLVAKRMDMYLDVGEGFGMKHRATPILDPEKPGTFVFTGLAGFGSATAFRIDPQPHGPLALAGFSIRVRLADGAEFEVEPRETVTNGRIVAERYEFPGDDPQIVVTLPNAVVIDRVEFEFEKAPCFAERTEKEAGAQPKARSLFHRRK